MLKALEIIGFKSFADKTRLEFPRGITVVVGPNGSGKSNVVDAVKWVLGEQSVKSLRGREMADVIFNGSGSRRMMNSAEVTLTFDNAAAQLALDTPEVHITRRVYRSGEGEYLINRQPSRLRDIRDLLAGTGLGAEAYSVIEQGKVDILLQASARDRRLIFEEAAGISRFKQRKLESLRRLERVDQNLLRLSDIVEEVQNRLHSVRAQAGKARRYKEYADRLQQLRTHAAWVDWQRLSQRLESVEAQSRALAEDRDAALSATAAVETNLQDTENRWSAIGEAIHDVESKTSAVRERIAAAESTIEHERARGRDLDEEITRHRQQLMATNSRAGDLQQQVQQTRSLFEAAQAENGQIAASLEDSEASLRQTADRLASGRSDLQRGRESLLRQMRLTAELGEEIGTLEARATSAAAARQRTLGQVADLTQRIEHSRLELNTLAHDRDEHARQVANKEATLGAANAQLTAHRDTLATLQAEQGQLRERTSGVAERAALLEEMEKKQEGLGAGVREVLALARSDDNALRHIHGLVADLFCVSVESAPLVEVILGPMVQYVVAPRHRELLDSLQNQTRRFTGRVGFVWLDQRSRKPLEPEVDLAGEPGVVGRADQLVQCEPQFAPLVQRLLGRAWVVQDLSAAFALAETYRGLNFVTVAGELLAADGTLVVGSRHATAGLISRRSQLRALHEQLAQMHAQMSQLQASANQLQQRIAQQENHVRALAEQHRQAAELLGEFRVKITVAQQQQAQLERQQTELDAEARLATDEESLALQALADAESRKEAAEAVSAAMQSELSALAEQNQRWEEEHRQRTQAATEIKVQLGKSEERCGSLRLRLQQVEEGREEREKAIVEIRQQVDASRQRAAQSQRNMLAAETELADLYLRKEETLAQTADLLAQQTTIHGQRAELGLQLQQLREVLRKAEESLYAKQLEANQLQLERTALVNRLREDYGVELAQLSEESTAQQQHERQEVQQEIDGLRQKIANLGNVNLEALEELELLETRFQALNGQYQDLVAGKATLEKIIERINVDSRRLFEETLNLVKGHFQTLFRDLFGGGQADIVLEEGVDILESGIEIVARPPGKEPRNISLLSGGEKTLTCVALLLAIFRSRPSPFCILDEVDAALDEANIDRFIKVLEEFAATTQFIIVTHSKKTMTCATTIYGVTMQESGISKQVSVRFEDVSENGEIRAERLAQEPPSDPDQARAA